MNVRHKETAGEVRERIARVAEDLFRRMGFAKTTVADIAAELSMSPANVYRFFPSKEAIVKTICERCLAEMEAQVDAAAVAPGAPAQKLNRIYSTILAYHRANFLDERRVHDMVLVAIEHNWDAIERHKARIGEAVARVLAEGIASGALVPHDPAQVSRILLGALVRFCHPVLVAQCIDDDLDAELAATLPFLLRALDVERAPLR